MMINKSRRSPSRFLALVGLTLLVSLLAMLPVASADGGDPTPAPTTYIVQPGDTWNTVSASTGATVPELIRLNPQAVHPHYWLWVGDRLQIPALPPATSEGYWRLVRPGDTWGSLATASGVSMEALWDANPSLLDWQRWLYVGQRVWIPAAPPAAASVAAQAAAEAVAGALAGAAAPSTAAPAATPAAEGQATAAAPATGATPPAETPAAITVTVTMTTTAAAVAAPSATPEAAAPIEPPATATAAPIPAPSATPAAAAPAQPTATLVVTSPAKPQAAGCPAVLAGYPDAITAYLNDKAHTPDGLKTWLASCNAVAQGQAGVTVAALQSAKSADVVVAIADPASAAAEAKGTLLVYHAQAAGGYTLAKQVDGEGAVALLKTGDINADGKSDLVWTDTTCGAHTCTSALYVDSWDGKAYQSWIEGSPKLTSADYAFMDVSAAGAGQEILINGGLIGSAGAGPQRGWTETYASPNGGPYKRIEKTYEKSPCLYHAILDADSALSDWATQGFEPAITAYQTALADQTLTACWTLQNEVGMLRDYAQFRLVVAQVAGGEAALGEEAAGKINAAAVKGLAQAFLKSYKASGSVIQACRDTTDYAKAHPDAWQFMADWGYANPTFTVDEVCPLK